MGLCIEICIANVVKTVKLLQEDNTVPNLNRGRCNDYSERKYIQVNGSATGPKGLRDSLPCMVTCSWIRSGYRLTTYTEHWNYGATGSPFFSLYGKPLAQATTLTGQCLIRSVSENISRFIDKSIGSKNPDPDKYIIAGDTDSVGPDTILNLQTDNGKIDITIEDFYNSINDEDSYQLKNEKQKQYVKRVTNVSSLTIENNQLIYSPVKYVMKHKVKKRMYRLKINGKTIDITEDHSLMCEREDKLIKVKPNELRKTDYIITLIDK